jgi:hypothetical protein
VHPSDADAAAVRLLDALNAAAGRTTRHDVTTQAPAMLRDAWRDAATCVAAATDLLATHHDSDGAQRSPTAWLLDEPRVRAAGVGALAYTTQIVAGDATPLGLRALEAGIDARRTRMLARLPATVAPAARQLRIACSPSAGYPELADLELARAAIRTDHPRHELADRLARLHRGAWKLVRERHVGVTTLTDYAGLRVLVHAHAAALLTAMAGPEGGGGRTAAAEPLIPGIKHSGAAWRRLHRHLSDLCTATPGSPGVQRDVQRVQSLLHDHVSLHPSDGIPESLPDRQLAATALGALRSLTAVAGWNAQVFTTLAATRQLHIDGARLTGYEVSNRADLVAAKLLGGLAPVTPDRLVAVRDGYRSVADAQKMVSTTGDTLRAAPAPAATRLLLDASPPDRMHPPT